MRKPPDIPQLIRNNDRQGLEKALRYGGDPEIREQAALGLARLMDPQAIESLIRSHLQDPDEAVRNISRQALDILVGEETARNAVDAFDRIGISREPWLIEDYDENESEVVQTGDWNTADIQGLVSVLINERDTRMRLKAIKVLRNLNNTHAVETLAGTVLWDENDEVKMAARKVLEEIFGDRLEEVLDFYRGSDEDETEEESNEKGLPEVFSPIAGFPPRQKQIHAPASPVVQEDNPAVRFLVAGLIILILAVLVFFFFLR